VAVLAVALVAAVVVATKTVAVLVEVVAAVAPAGVVLVAAFLPPKHPNKKARLSSGLFYAQSR
jgi:hypothetical protein